jgi:predicted dehydrogenase
MMRIAVLGVAHLHADDYVANLRSSSAAVVGVFDHDAVRAGWWGRKFGVTVFEDLTELLSQKLDGVVVCAETVHHCELVEAAAEAGVSVLCEKPLGVGIEDSRRIVEVCAEKGVILMTALPVRLSPAVRQVRDLVADGELGRVRALSGTNQSVMPMRERAWFVDPTLAGGGAIMDHVVHLADAFTWILGAEPEEVYAVSNRIVHPEVVTVETSGLVMVGYPGGVFASIDCSWNRPLNYPTWGGLALSVVGDGGTLEVDPGKQRMTQFGGPDKYSWVPWGFDSNQLMIEEFLDSIDMGRRPLVTGENGLSTTVVALAALESARCGESVRLDQFAAAGHAAPPPR